MKPTFILIAGVLLVITACKNNPKPDLSGMTDSDTTKLNPTADADAARKPEMDSAAMMKAWQDFMTPGDMHKWMAKWDGTWTGESAAWMDPSAPPEKSSTTATQKMIMNGLYQQTDFTGTMMGQPFQGHGILAYDNAKKEFVSTWIDNMGSGVLVMRGTWDEATQTLNLKGTQTDPTTGKDSDIREEVRFPDDNTQVISIFGPGMDGKEMKYMEINLKRKV
jgi:hypothetical protein